MTIPKSKKNRNFIKYIFYLAFLLLGVCIGLLASWGFRRENSGQEPDSAVTNDYTPEADAQEAAGTDRIVDYPFSYNQEGWQLILHDETVENESNPPHSEREFRLYNERDQLVQAFPCGLDAK